MAAFPGEGVRDIRRRLRIIGLLAVRSRVRRDLFRAEAELGWLAWEQVDFFDEYTLAEINKIKEFEATQAALQNTSAELSSRKALLDEDVARDKALHDQTQTTLAAERTPLAVQLDHVETIHTRKLEAIERFDRAIAEIAGIEKEFERHSLAFMKIQSPTLEIRTEARKVSDELVRLASERSLVIADKERAAREAAGLESEIAHLRAEVDRIDTSAAAARETLAATTRRIAAEKRLLDRERKKSASHMSHLDRKKQQPYRFIGSCMADHSIAPLNQPAVLEKVFELREREFSLTETLAKLRVACASVDPGLLLAFYFLLFASLIIAVVLGHHFVH